MSNPTDAPPDIPQYEPLPPEETSGAGAVAPPPSAQEGEKAYTQSFFRWFGFGTVRVLYRPWTRIAANWFPEGSRQARIMERLGVPLPDRLDLSWITPDIAVGGRVRVGDIPKLQRVGVTRVVDVRQEHRDDEAALNTHGIELLYLPTPDTYPLSLADLRRGAEWINMQRQAHQRVLIHCEHGVGRSVLLAAAALVCEGYSAHAAFDLIGRKRWQAAPNHRQVARLSEFARAGACQGDA